MKGVAKQAIIRLDRRDWWKKGRQPSSAQLVLLQPQFKPFKDDQVYTCAEIASGLKRSVWQVYRYIKSEKFEAEPVGNGYLIRGQAVNEYLFRLKLKKKGYKHGSEKKVRALPSPVRGRERTEEECVFPIEE